MGLHSILLNPFYYTELYIEISVKFWHMVLVEFHSADVAFFT